MPTLSRRDALKALVLLPLAERLEPGEGPLQRALAEMRQGPRQGASRPRFFTPREWRLVRMLADYVIPADERSGSATDAKVPEFIDFLMADPDASMASRVAMRGGLAWLDGECRTRFRRTFVECTDAQRRQVLDDIAWPKKAKAQHSHGVAFFNRFRDLTASGFFSSAMGWRDVQYRGNVFNPNWDGCPPPALEKLGVSYDLMTTRVAPQ